MNMAFGDHSDDSCQRGEPPPDGALKGASEHSGSVVVPTSLPELEPGAVAQSPAEGEDPMELYERHLKEQDWGHQPC